MLLCGLHMLGERDAEAALGLGRSARICSTRFIGAIGGRCIGTIGMVYPGTLFHRRQRGISMHSYENRSQIRALRRSHGHFAQLLVDFTPDPLR
jgi:hypothetical protein